MIISVFFLFDHYLLYKPELYWSEKTQKKSLNHKPIKTVTEHLIKITNHKMHGVQNTHSSH